MTRRWGDAICMNMNELLLRLQIWAMQDNVSFLKKRYLFFSGVVIYSLEFMLRLIVDYFYPSRNLRAIESLNLFMVQIFILVAITYSLVSIVFVYICRLAGVRNLYACMLLFGVVTILWSVLSGWEWHLRAGIVVFLFDIMGLTFASVIAIAWVSLRLQHLFSRKPANTT